MATFEDFNEDPKVTIQATGLTSMVGLTSSGTIKFNGLTSCDTIDTDASGVLSCGSDATGGGGGGGSSEWTDGGTVLYPNELGDDVAIGTDTALGHFTVLGDSDEAQMVVRAATGQTADVFVFEAQRS